MAADAPSGESRVGKRQATPRFIYFIQGIHTRLIKVGSADDVLKRHRELQAASPDLLHILGVEEPRDAWKTERELHRRWRLHRRHGEWFEPVAEIHAYIQGFAREAPAPAPEQVTKAVYRKLARDDALSADEKRRNVYG